MGIFNKLFKGEKNEDDSNRSGIPWIELKAIDQLEKIEETSEEKTIAIFKHSTRCGVSRMVLRMFETDYDLKEDAPVELYFLDLISYRDISNEIAERFKVRHESPQLIVIKNREVVHHSSHQGVSAGKLKELA